MEENTYEDEKLLFIEQVEHDQHIIKIARRRSQIKLLIYPPGAVLATQMVVDELANYEAAIAKAKALIEGRATNDG